MFTLHFHAGKLKSVTSSFFISFNDQLLFYIPSLIKSKECFYMYVLYLSLENLLYNETKFLSLKIIHCQKSHGTKKSKFYPKRLVAFKIQSSSNI